MRMRAVWTRSRWGEKEGMETGKETVRCSLWLVFYVIIIIQKDKYYFTNKNNKQMKKLRFLVLLAALFLPLVTRH